MLVLICPTHPHYQGDRPPEHSNCHVCAAMWSAVRELAWAVPFYEPASRRCRSDPVWLPDSQKSP